MGGRHVPLDPAMERATGDRGVAGSRGLDAAGVAYPVAGAWVGSWIPGLGPSLLAPVTRNAGAFGGGLVAGAFGGMVPDSVGQAVSQTGGTVYLSSGAFLLHHPLIFLDGCWDGVWEELQGWWELAWSLLSLEEWTKLVGRLGEVVRILFGDAETAFFCGWTVGEGTTGSVAGVLQGDGETIAYEAGVLLGPILLELAGTLVLGLGLAKMGVRTATGAGARVIDGLVDAVRRGGVPPDAAGRMRAALPGNTSTIRMPPSPRDRPRIELPDSPGPLDDDLPTSPVPGVASTRVPPEPGPGAPIPGVASARATGERGLGPRAGKPPREAGRDGPGRTADAPEPTAAELRADASATPGRFRAGLQLASAAIGFKKLKTAMGVAPRVTVEVLATGRSYFGRDAVGLRFRLKGADFSLSREADLIEARYAIFQEQIDRFLEDFQVPPRPLPSADIPRTRSREYDYAQLPGTAVDEAMPRMFEGYRDVGRDRSPRGDRPLGPPADRYLVQEEAQMRIPDYLNSIFGVMDTRGRDLMVEHPRLHGYDTLLDRVEIVWDGGRPTRDPP